MIVLTIGTGIFITLYSINKYRDKLCPLNIFIPFFTVCTFLGSLALYGKNQGSTMAYMLIFLSLLTYFISFEILSRIHISRSTRHMGWENFEYTSINKKLIYILAIFSLFVNTSKFIKTLPLLLSGLSLGEVRGEYLTGNASAMSSFIDAGISSGALLALMIVVSIELIFEQKKDIVFFFLVFVNVLISTFSTGGRLLIYDFAVILLFSFLCYRSFFAGDTIINTIAEMRNNKKTRKTVVFMIAVGVLALITITIERQGQTESFMEALYADFSCFVPLMSKTIEMVHDSGDLTFGISSFDGVIIIINIILSLLRLPQITGVNTINKYDAVFLNIGGGNYANAYVSYVFYFYLDGRIIGVVLGNILFGIMSARIYRRLKKEPGKRSVAMFLFLIYLIFRTMIRWSFNQASVVIAFVLLLVIYKRSSASRKVVTFGEHRLV